MKRWKIINDDCLTAMDNLDNNSVDLIVTDPPYYRVKSEHWDRQWDSPARFLAWLDSVATQWQRVLRPNGSLYCFASPKMSARVECLLGQRFEILNCIRWNKDAGWHKKAEKEALRSFLSPWESVIFCEHPGADSIAKGEAGYGAKCDEIRGFVFEPIREYLDGELRRAGLKPDDVNVPLGFREQGGMAGRHYFRTSQWQLPTAEHYYKLQRFFKSHGRKPAPDYESFHTAPRERYEHERATSYDYLRADYENLRADYENLRRPFAVTQNVPHTDVWDFKPAPPRPGRHPCEKPLPMMKHIVKTSSRPGALVLDSFMGTGVVGVACLELGRRFIGVDTDAGYCKLAAEQLRAVQVSSSPVSHVEL
jgi:site-specific DNA-methyltransferase (adenine-specific)